jgi:hypothetical protein
MNISESLNHVTENVAYLTIHAHLYNPSTAIVKCAPQQVKTIKNNTSYALPLPP